jgi:hypothetical protein
MSRLVFLLVTLSLVGCAKNSSKNTQTVTEPTDEEPVEPTDPILLTMTAPSSGGIVDVDSVTAEGTWSGGLDTVVAVNGTDVGPAGSWSVNTDHAAVLWPDSPLWPVLADARDAEGSWARARATLIQGASTPALDIIEDGLMFRLTENVLGEIDGLLDSVVADLDLSSLLVSSDPVASVLGSDIYIVGGTFGELVPTVDFTASALEYTLRVEDVVINLETSGGVLGGLDLDLEADAVTVSGNLVLGVDADGGLTATPGGTSVTTENIELFGITDSWGLVDSLLGDTVATTIDEELVEAIDGLLEAQEELRYLEISGISVLSDFVDVVHDSFGVTIIADSRIELADGSSPGDRLTTDERLSVPSGTTSPDGVAYQGGLFLDDDLLSAIGAALAAGDLLEQEVDGDLGGLTLDTSLLGNIVPAFETLPPGQPVSISTRPSVPLVGRAGRVGYAGELHLGGLTLDLKTDQDGDGAEDVVMTVMLDAVIGLAAGEGEELIAIDLIDSQSTLLSTTLEADLDETEAGLASLINIAVPALVNGLLGDTLDLDLDGLQLTVVDGAGVGNRVGLFLDVDFSELDL